MRAAYHRIEDGLKFCRACERTLPIQSFSPNGGPGLYRPLCKECTAVAKRTDSERAKNRARKKRAYKLKRAEIDRHNMKWRRANPERARAIQRASQKRSRKARPEQYRAVGRRQARRRLLGRNQAAIEYADILLRDPCAYCGAPATTVDHVDALAVGGLNEWTNLTAACAACNSSKRHMPVLIWMAARAEQNTPDE